MSDVVGKLWGFCHTLRHDGVDYGDYIEQLTYLLFLKMAEEKGADIPKEYSWPVLREKAGMSRAVLARTGSPPVATSAAITEARQPGRHHEVALVHNEVQRVDGRQAPEADRGLVELEDGFGHASLGAVSSPPAGISG